MPDSAGPGRTNATAATVSSSVRACSMRNRWRMAGDSSWKQLSVSPAAMAAAAIGSSSGTASGSGAGDVTSPASVTHSPIVVMARLPSRSILTKPIASTARISNCDTTTPLAARSSGR